MHATNIFQAIKKHKMYSGGLILGRCYFFSFFYRSYYFNLLFIVKVNIEYHFQISQLTIVSGIFL